MSSPDFPSRLTILTAAGVLFALPLAIFMGHSLPLSPAIAPWVGLAIGAIYATCALSALSLLFSRQRDALNTAVSLASEELRHKLDQAMDQAAKARLTLQERGDRISALEAQVDELHGQLQARDHPVAMKGKRDIIEAVPTPEKQQWIEEPLPLTTNEVHTQYDALLLLQRCLVKAQTLTGVHHMGDKFRRIRDLSLDNVTIDLRRLFDAMQHETSAAILLFSRDEGRLLFANDVVTGLFGWSADRFLRDFATLIKGGRDHWEEAMASLEIGTQASLRLVINAKKGEDILVHTVWSIIPTGVFMGMVVGVLYK